MPLTSRSYPKATPHTEQEFNDGLAVLGSKLSRVASAGGAALAAGLAGRSALRAAQSAAYPTRYAPWWDKAAAVAGPLYGAYQYSRSAVSNAKHAWEGDRWSTRPVSHHRSRPFLQSWRIKKYSPQRARRFSRTRFGLRRRHVVRRRGSRGSVE